MKKNFYLNFILNLDQNGQELESSLKDEQKTNLKIDSFLHLEKQQLRQRNKSENKEGKCVRSEKMGDLIKYIPAVVEALKADVNSLPKDLELDSDIILYSNAMRDKDDTSKQNIEKVEKEEEKSRSYTEVI